MQVPTVQSNEIRNQFMMLLLAQLRNQDPLSPVQQHEFIAQLAQFSSLEGIERLNDGVKQLSDLQESTARQQELLEASQLIGRTVSFTRMVPGADGAPERPQTLQGVVGGVLVEPEGVRLAVGGERVSLRQVSSVLPTPNAAFTASSASGQQTNSTAGVTAGGPSNDAISGLLDQLESIL